MASVKLAVPIAKAVFLRLPVQPAQQATSLRLMEVVLPTCNQILLVQSKTVVNAVQAHPIAQIAQLDTIYQ